VPKKLSLEEVKAHPVTKALMRLALILDQKSKTPLQSSPPPWSRVSWAQSELGPSNSRFRSLHSWHFWLMQSRLSRAVALELKASSRRGQSSSFRSCWNSRLTRIVVSNLLVAHCWNRCSWHKCHCNLFAILQSPRACALARFGRPADGRNGRGWRARGQSAAQSDQATRLNVFFEGDRRVERASAFISDSVGRRELSFTPAFFVTYLLDSHSQYPVHITM